MSGVTTEGAAPVATAPRFEIPSLDGVRLISILYVFVAHAGLDHIIPGGFGVTIFFFLSGYLITTLMRREYDRQGTVSLRHFYMRRAVRIWPAFYLVLTTGVVLTLTGVLPGTLSLRDTLLQYFHLANYGIIEYGNGAIVLGSEVYWSLAVEEHFYLLFPLLYLGLRRMRMSAGAVAGVLLALCAAILVWRLVLVLGMGVGEFRTYYGSDTRFDSIVFGCALAAWHNPALDPPVLRPKVWAITLVGALVVLLSTFVIRNDSYRETLRYTVQGIGLVPVFYCAVRFPHWWCFKPLNHPTAKFLGTLSYSFYLVHFTVLLGLAARFPSLHGLTRGVISLVVSFVLAYGVFRLVEKPLAPLRHRLGRT